jgi:hypothetical protein
MGQDQDSATGCSPALQAVYGKQAEHLSVGKTKVIGQTTQLDNHFGAISFSSVTTIERKRQLTSVVLPGQRYVKAMVPPAVSLRRPQGLGGAQLPLGQSWWLANAAPSATDRILAQPMSG